MKNTAAWRRADIAALVGRQHDHLREITSHDVLAAIESLPASARSQALVVLRSLFKFLKREKRIFVNPTAQLRPGRVQLSVLLSIDEDAYRRAVRRGHHGHNTESR